EREELAAGGQMGEVGDGDEDAADLGPQYLHLLMRQGEKGLDEPELVHHLEGRGMDGVAAEVTEEVCVLLQHDHVHAGAGEEKAQHHAGGPAAHDAAAVALPLIVHGAHMMDFPASTIRVAPVM